VRRAPHAFCALVLLAGAACGQTFDATTLGVPVTMAAPAGQTVTGTKFRTTAHSVHVLFGILTISQPSLQKALARELVGGQEVTQVRIRTRSRFWDIVVTGITLGMIVPRSVTYEGVIVGR
jgi:hypothetical protein